MEASSWPPEAEPRWSPWESASLTCPGLCSQIIALDFLFQLHKYYLVSVVITFEDSWAPAGGWQVWWDGWLTPTRGLDLFIQDAPYCFSVFGSQSFMLPYFPFSVKNQKLALISWHVHFPLPGACAPRSHPPSGSGERRLPLTVTGRVSLPCLFLAVLNTLLSVRNRATTLISAVSPI